MGAGLNWMVCMAVRQGGGGNSHQMDRYRNNEALTQLDLILLELTLSCRGCLHKMAGMGVVSGHWGK